MILTANILLIGIGDILKDMLVVVLDLLRLTLS